MKAYVHQLIVFAAPLSGTGCFADTNTFTVATYNLENWLFMERYGSNNLPARVTGKQ